MKLFLDTSTLKKLYFKEEETSVVDIALSGDKLLNSFLEAENILISVKRA